MVRCAFGRCRSHGLGPCPRMLNRPVSAGRSPVRLKCAGPGPRPGPDPNQNPGPWPAREESTEDQTQSPADPPGHAGVSFSPGSPAAVHAPPTKRGPFTGFGAILFGCGLPPTPGSRPTTGKAGGRPQQSWKTTDPAPVFASREAARRRPERWWPAAGKANGPRNTRTPRYPSATPLADEIHRWLAERRSAAVPASLLAGPARRPPLCAPAPRTAGGRWRGRRLLLTATSRYV